MRHAWLVTVLAITALASACPAAEVVTQPFLGVTLIHRTETSPRLLDIHLAIIDTLAPGIRFHATPESPHADDLTIAQTTRSFVTQVGAQLGINGDFYSSAGTINGFVHRDPSSFAASDGNIYSSFSTFEPAFNIAKNNVAHAIVANSQTAAGKRQPNPDVPVWNAVGGNGYLVNNGSLPTYWNNPSHHLYAFANALHPRTAIGVSADRARIALFVVDGRQSHSGGMNFPEMADMLLNDYGMHWAINLDGGGSTTMAIADHTPRVLNKPSDGSERPVGNNLVVFARPAPPPIPESALALSYQEQAGVYTHVGAQIRSGAPTENAAGNAALRVGYGTSQGKTRGVFSFDLSGIASDATIHSVSLTLDAFDASGATGNRYVDLELFRLDAQIIENQVTWNQSKSGSNWTTAGGDFSGPALSSLFAQQTTGLKTFVSTVDFVTAAQAALTAGKPLSLLVAARDAEAWGAANSANLNLRFRSDDATTGQRPLLTLHYTLALLDGDYNADGNVDAADYVVWRKNNGSAAEYATWRANFGMTELSSGNGAAANSSVAIANQPVPEPTTCLLALLGIALVVASRKAQRP